MEQKIKTEDVVIKLEQESEEEDSDESEDDEVEKEDEATKKARLRKKLYDAQRRKNWTPERRERERERARQRRKNMTPEQREKENERKRKLRAGNMEEENEGDGDIRADWTEEQRARERERARKRRAAMSEEVRKMENEERKLRMQKQKERLGEEEFKRRRRERIKMKEMEEGPEERRKRLDLRAQRAREKRANMSEDEKFRFQMKRYLYYRSRMDSMSKEEREEWLRKNREHVYSYYRKVPPEKREEIRRKQNLLSRENAKKYYKRPEIRMKLLEYYRNRLPNETPEQRQKRLYKYKVNTAQRKLRKQLEEEGNLSKEEIDERVKELGKQMWSIPLPPPTEQELSQYKPRPSGRKPKKGKVFQEVPEELFQEPPKSKLPPISSLWPISTTPKQCDSNAVAIIVNSEIGDLQEQPVTPDTSFCQSPQVSQAATCSEELAKLNLPETDDDSQCAYFDDDGYNDDGSVGLPEQDVQISFAEDYPETSSDPIITPSWKCPRCSEVLSSHSDLRAHYTKTHVNSVDKFKFLCMRCPWKTNDLNKRCRFKSSRRLHCHVQTYHPYFFWPCASCNLLLYSESRYNSHFSKCSSALKIKMKKPVVCEDCGKSFVSDKTYRMHRHRTHHPDKSNFICPHCNKSLGDTKSFWLHFVRCSKLLPEIDIPKQPSVPNTNTSRQQRPVKSDTGTSTDQKKRFGPIPCEQCGKTFSQRATLDDHVRREHEGQVIMCSECGRNFQSAGKLWRHQAEVHKMTDLPPPPGVEVFRCKYCNDFVMRGYESHVKKKHPESWEDFEQNELPKVAERMKWVKFENPKQPLYFKYDKRKKYTSQGNLIVECTICQAKLSRHCIKRHMNRMHPVVPFFSKPDVEKDKLRVTCTECGKRFRNRSSFSRHYAEMHTTYEGIEEKLVTKGLLEYKPTKTIEGIPTKYARCLLCNVDLPMNKLSTRCHFVASHYELLLQINESP